MEKKTKKYLELCGVNSIVLFTLAFRIMKKLQNDGYELINNKHSFKDYVLFIGDLLIPVINVAYSLVFLSMNINKDLYEYIKVELLKKDMIKPTERVFDKYNKTNLSIEEFEERKKLEIILFDKGYTRYVNGKREWIDKNEEKNKVKQIEKYHRNYVQIR